MEKDEPKTKIPDPQLEALKLFTDQVSEVRKSFNFVITFVIGVMLLGFVVLLLMTVQLVIDAWRFNAVVYKESQQLNLQAENIKNTVELGKTIVDELQSIQKGLNEIKPKK